MSRTAPIKNDIYRNVFLVVPAYAQRIIGYREDWDQQRSGYRERREELMKNTSIDRSYCLNDETERLETNSFIKGDVQF